MNPKRVLLIGYGNPGRVDDGLGPALAVKLAEKDIENLTVESDYQLTLEDAHTIAQHDVVVFADATTDTQVEDFKFSRLEPSGSTASFSTHSADPADLLSLANALFKKDAEAYILAIRGYEFDTFNENLTEKAKKNLEKAADFMENSLRDSMFAATTT